ncbi:poly(U)-specific 3'-to-5' RNA exonuclease [Coemansia sp. RSA 486]|nr:poly(U)-specific 3'-to-5' RNA exonuclease [Coemansia sp. RSA 486]KAJ2602306.1 poly(U)-specific 3'-to-5' RNA exonuclease [Coemansia sp. RSA 1721]KAJ2640466.1 poly(U)-specific 3'-to-5' RNA exonuclease [Coemansia sp. RSA 1286]
MSLKLVDYPSSDESSSSGDRNKSSGNNKQSYCEQSETKEPGQNTSEEKQENEGADAGHVQGGWAGRVFLEVDTDRQLHRFGLRCMDRLRREGRAGHGSSNSKTEALRIIGSKDMQSCEALHVSLTRPFYVQEHQISAFVEALQTSVRGYGQFAVGFERVSTYVNERGNRGFVALDVGAGRNSIGGLLDRVDRVMERMGKREFYSRPRFHVSLAWMRVKGEQQIQALEAAGEWLGTAMQEEILYLAATQIDTLVCIFGNRRFRITLG